MRSIYLRYVFQFPKNVTIHGNIEAIGGGLIDGEVDGDVKTEGDLTIGKNGFVRGNVHATNLKIHGKVFGDVVCSHKAIIIDKGYVKGNVSGMILDIEEGAIVEGIIRQGPEEIPVEEPVEIAVEEEGIVEEIEPTEEEKPEDEVQVVVYDETMEKWF